VLTKKYNFNLFLLSKIGKLRSKLEAKHGMQQR